MTVAELIEALDDFGGHLNVVVEWPDGVAQSFELRAGRDGDGVAACVIVADR